MPRETKNLLLLIFLVIAAGCSKGTIKKSLLEDNFINPPQDCKPRTWMHAMSGNMSKEGLTKDLESMAKVGIGGLLLFNITQGIPNGKIIYNSPEHHEMIKHVAQEAERLGLSFGVHNCDGWSSSGGPWVTPEESMKMIVWTEKVVDGGAINTFLQKPTTREGLYQDIAVVAYPSLASEVDDANLQPAITSSDTALDISKISDGKIDAVSSLKKTGNDPPWIQYHYRNPKTIRSVKIIFNERHATATLQVSTDGINFSDARELLKVRTGKGEWAINDHFDGITANYFRLKFNQNVTIKEALLSSNYFIQNPLARTLIARTEDEKLGSIGTPAKDMVIDKSQIRTLSEYMDSNGQLSTELPKGKWSVLRFGYTSTGAFNNPASDEGRGLEVDKLNRNHFKNFFNGFVKKVIDNTKAVAPTALQYIEIDSYEMGGQNWTNHLDSIFAIQKGYDIIPFLPLIAGRFVESAASSEAVLSDFRSVVTNLMTENYFSYFTELCNDAGLKSYIEPYGFGPLNDLDIGGQTDLPMGEFWMNRPITQTASAVSSAHIYGKSVISAESFTSNPTINWKGNPAMAKTSGDLAWTYGINEFMFHRFVHQANVHVEPGMTMNRWGFHFDRTQTWWENAGADWFKYIARGSHLLRQGHPVSDLLIYVGEGTPNGSYHRSELTPHIPKTLNFDNVNTDVLLNRLTIDENRLVLPEGTSYKILYLKNSKYISLNTAARIYEIAKSGIPVYGDMPEGLIGYNNPDAVQKEFAKIKAELSSLILPVDDWNEALSQHRISPDLIVHGLKDIDYVHRRSEEGDIYFFFNSDTSGVQYYDISFRVSNKIPELWNPMTGKIIKKADFVCENSSTRTHVKLNAGESIFVVFREDATGVEAVMSSDTLIDYSYIDQNRIRARISQNGTYIIPTSSGKSKHFDLTNLPDPIIVDEEWTVSFDEQGGYGGTIQMSSLSDWKDHPKDSIKYYSGTATYHTIFNLPTDLEMGDLGAILDLGSVHIAAEVFINEKLVGITWMAPYQLDISEYIIAGKNRIEIRLTNQWSNRLIGDERFPPNDGGYQLGPHRATDLTMPEWYVNNEPRPKGERTTFTTAPFYKKDSPLMPSGLLGPVKIMFYRELNNLLQ